MYYSLIFDFYEIHIKMIDNMILIPTVGICYRLVKLELVKVKTCWFLISSDNIVFGVLPGFYASGRFLLNRICFTEALVEEDHQSTNLCSKSSWTKYISDFFGEIFVIQNEVSEVIVSPVLIKTACIYIVMVCHLSLICQRFCIKAAFTMLHFLLLKLIKLEVHPCL